MAACPRTLPLRLHRAGALAAAILAAVPVCATAATFNWSSNSPGSTNWGLPSNWGQASAYPGSDAGMLNDVAVISPSASIGGTLTISYNGTPAPSLGTLTLARGSAGGDTLHLSIDAPMIVGSVTIDSGNNTPAKLFLDVNTDSSFNSVTIVRTESGDGAPDGPGLHIKNGNTTIGTLIVGSSTVNTFAAAAEISGGTLTVTGPTFLVGTQNTGSNSKAASGIFVDGGTLIGTNPAGLVVARAGQPNLGASFGQLNISSGTVLLEKLTLAGQQNSTQPISTVNTGSLTLSGGALFLGSGGLIGNQAFTSNGSKLGSTYFITLGGGTLGASADWASSARMIFLNSVASGNATALRAADINGNPHNILFSGSLTGSGGFRKTGPGTLTLTSSSNTYTGGTQVSQGTLLVATQFNTATGTGTITVENGATYGGSGNNATIGSIIVNPGGHIAPGLPDTNDGVGVLNVNNLQFNPGSFYDVDFTADASANDQITVFNASTLTLSDPVNVTLSQLGQSFAAPGTYTLFTGVSNLVGIPGNLHVANPGTGVNYQFSLLNTNLLLTISNSASGPINGAWLGTLGSDWTAPGNWTGGQVPGTITGDTAAFGPAAVSFAVNLNANQRLAAWTIDPGTNSGYAFAAGVAGSKLLLDNGTSSAALTVSSGVNTASHDVLLVSDTQISVAAGAQLLLSGTLASGTTNSATSVTLTGGGTLILAADNAYGGSTTISAGTLQIGNAGAAGRVGAGPILNAGSLVVNRSDAFSLSNPITGTGTLIHSGTGTTTLTGAANYSGTTTINAGKLAFGGATSHSVAGVTGPGTLQVASGATLTSDGITTSTWQIDGTHVIRPNGTATGVSRVNGFGIAGTTGAWSGKLDLTNNALVINAADPAAQAAIITTLKDQVTSGSAGGTWTGTGITSSSLIVPGGAGKNLAIVDAGDLALTAYRGQSNLDANATIVVVAIDGDATLDNKVDSQDLNALAAHWQQPAGAIWSSGDFTGDGKVNSSDLNVLAAHWQTGAGIGLSSANFAQINALIVPEPASTTIFAIGAPLLLIRRRDLKKCVKFHLPRVRIRGIYIPNLFLGV